MTTTNPIDELTLFLTVGRALIELLPDQDQIYPNAWVEHLSEYLTNSEEIGLALDYACYLTSMIANTNDVKEPFNKAPRNEKLVPLDANIKTEILQTAESKLDGHLEWAQNLIEEVNLGPVAVPEKFLAVQPKPNHGSIAYMAAFSQDPTIP